MPARMRLAAVLTFAVASVICSLLICPSLFGQTTTGRPTTRIHPSARRLAVRPRTNSQQVRRVRQVSTKKPETAGKVATASHVVAAPMYGTSPSQPAVAQVSFHADPMVVGSGCWCCGNLEPLGSSFYAHFNAQIFNGMKAQQVLYQYDFENGPTDDQTRLNWAGRRKIIHLLPTLESTGVPLTVERVAGQPDVSEARRLNVVSFLQSHLGVPIADDQVVIGSAATPGIRGVEALEVNRNQLQTTRAQGVLSANRQSTQNNISNRNVSSRP
jgi:hypothetical protein